jgi:hypothetical protein
MWMDADSDEKGHAGDYCADLGGADYDGASSGDGWDPRDDRAYWRRRFLILCGGVVALGVCAWMLPGAHQPAKREVAAASASLAALAKSQALPSAATGASWHGDTMPDAYPTAAASIASTTKQAPKKPGEKASTAYRPAQSAATRGAKGSACAPTDIVLSLSTSQPSYDSGAHPSFDVYAVSTAATACTLTYGVGSVQVFVTHGGHVVWDSAACKPTPARTVRFTLGVPQVLTMVWNPTVKKPAGCAGSLPAGTSGTLDAVATSHGQSSSVAAFKLSG